MAVYTRTPTLVCDIDGVIATGSVEEVYSDEAGWAYEKCVAIPKTINILRELFLRGVCIILHTARHASDKEKTVAWLYANKVLYSRLVMDKPYGHVYLDDRSFGYKSFEDLLGLCSEEAIVNTLYKSLLSISGD